MVRDTTDPDFADDFAKYLEARRMVSELTVFRTRLGLTQEVATLLTGWPVQEIEESTDAEVDVNGYVDAWSLAILNGTAAFAVTG